MRLRSLLQAVLVALACLASGTLECGGPPVTEPVLRGAAFYGRMCAVCHGKDGEGYAADFAPALASAQFLEVASDRYLQTAISSGRSGTTMSAWGALRGGPLGPREIEAVVAFLRSRAEAPPATLDDSPSKGDPSRGARVFAALCARCHGDKGAAGPYERIGGRDLLGSAGNGMLRATVRDGRPGTLMPSFAAELGPADIDDVIAALRLWQGQSVAEPRAAPAKPPPLPLGPVPLHPKGPDPVGFEKTPGTTKVDVVKRELDRGARMGILDARAPSDYMNEHIAGAVSVPFYDPSPYLGALPRDAWLVCYCSCPHAESGQLAQRLQGAGFTKVTVLDEGLNVWRSRKYGTSTGTDP